MNIIKCASCGVDNLDSVSTCRKCFQPITAAPVAAPVLSVPATAPSVYPEFLCVKCGYVGYQKNYMKGGFGLEILLWLLGLLSLFFIVGVLILIFALGYSLWRFANRYMGCPACGGSGMISVHSPVGRKFLSDLAK
jgi:hypothetical protein